MISAAVAGLRTGIELVDLYRYGTFVPQFLLQAAPKHAESVVMQILSQAQMPGQIPQVQILDSDRVVLTG